MADEERGPEVVVPAAAAPATPVKNGRSSSGSCSAQTWGIIACVSILLVVIICGVYFGVTGGGSVSDTTSSYSSVHAFGGMAMGCGVGKSMVFDASDNSWSSWYCCDAGTRDIRSPDCVKQAESGSGSNIPDIFKNTISNNFNSAGGFTVDFTDPWQNIGNFPDTTFNANADAVTSGPVALKTNCNAAASVACTGQCKACVQQVQSGAATVDFACKSMATTMNGCTDMNDGQCTMTFSNGAGNQFSHISGIYCMVMFAPIPTIPI